MIAWVAAAALASAGLAAESGPGDLDRLFDHGVHRPAPAPVDSDSTLGPSGPETLRGHAGKVLAAQFGLDGASVVTAAADKTARVWDAKTGLPVRTVPLTNAEDREVWTEEGPYPIEASASFSADRAYAVVIGSASVQVVDLRTGEVVRRLDARPEAAVLSPDGKRLLVGASKQASVWDVESGRQLCVMPQRKTVEKAAFNADGSRFLTAISAARVWDAATCTELRAYQPVDEDVESAAFSPDGKTIVTGGSRGSLHLWDAETGAELRVLRAHNGAVASVAFSPDGRKIASAGDKTVRVWDARAGQALKSLDHDSTVTSVAFSPDGSRIVAAAGRVAKVWRIGYSKEEREALKRDLEGKVQAAPAAQTKPRFQVQIE